MLPAGFVLKGRWKVTCKLGQGGFGQTFSAVDSFVHQEVAVKVEPATGKKQLLKLEIAILKKLQGCAYFCKLHGYGRSEAPPGLKDTPEDPNTPPEKDSRKDKFQVTQPVPINFIVMQLLGQNLSEIRKERKPESKFSIATTALLIKQMLYSIEMMHAAGYLHRDIKPSNFAMGLMPENMILFKDQKEITQRKRCYLIDFGLARRYLLSDGQVRKPRAKAGFRGTARYASLTSHRQKELSRRDDLWSLFYVMIEFLRGHLPWRREKDKAQIFPVKEKHTNESLTVGLPKACTLFYHYIKSLSYEDTPDYSYLQEILDDLFQCSCEPYSIEYDWEIKMEIDDIAGGSESFNIATSAVTGLRVASKREDVFTDLVEVNRELDKDIAQNKSPKGSAKHDLGEDPDHEKSLDEVEEEQYLCNYVKEDLDAAKAGSNIMLQDISNLSVRITDSKSQNGKIRTTKISTDESIRKDDHCAKENPLSLEKENAEQWIFQTKTEPCMQGVKHFLPPSNCKTFLPHPPDHSQSNQITASHIRARRYRKSSHQYL